MTANKFKIALVTILLVAMQAHAANVYRYKNDQGKTVYDSKVPAEYVKNGYEILNERGQVIQVVPRALTEEELAAQAEELEKQRQEEEARKKQEEEDNLLLRLYRSPDEIVRMRDEKVDQLDAQVTALNAMLMKVQEQIDSLEKIVANNKAAGKEAPANTLAKLEDAEKEKNRLSRQIERIAVERKETVDTAQKNIERLTKLLKL